MNELRKDYLLNRWVIIASERAKRPTDFLVKKEEYPVGACYFCPGNEKTTPVEIGRVEKDGRWSVRWFLNKYPATTEKNQELSQGFLTSRSAFGRHEIIVETPIHNQDFEELSLEDMETVFEVCASRIKQLNKLKGIEYVLVFKNRGRDAGASLAHSHFQVIALTKTPSLVEKEVKASRKYKQNTNRCILCDTLKKELKSERKVYEDKNVGVFTPYASRFPFEVWVMPKRHVKNIDEMTPSEKKSFTQAVKKTLLSLDKLINKPPYNFYLHVSPKKGDLHMHLEICPKLSIQAGFELGSDMYINVVPPEDAAKHYKRGI